jgi:tetratricopeptide (TPR) repeat protein
MAAKKLVTNQFARLTDEFIVRCQREFRTGIPMEEEAGVPDRVTRTIIARESLEADKLLKAEREELFDRDIATFSDWVLLCIAEFMEVLSSPEAVGSELTDEGLHAINKRGSDAFAQAMQSPTASPLVDYGFLYLTHGFALSRKKAPESLPALLTALAYEKEDELAENLLAILQAIGESLVRCVDPARGIRYLAELIRFRPEEISFYAAAGHILREAGAIDLARAAVQRGLDLIEGDPDFEEDREALNEELRKLEESEKAETPAADTTEEAGEGAEEKAPAEAAALHFAEEDRQAFLAALQLDLDEAEEIEDADFFAAQFPELETLERKRPTELADLDAFPPLDVLETIRRHGPKVGRNDPCPCGSGKKFKKCCMS